MRILIAPDSFKECLTATEVAKNIALGIIRVMPDAEITCIPIADGGEGTVEAITTATNGKIIGVNTFDALMRPISSYYGITSDGKTAIIEMAAASGLNFIKPSERNPLKTSTIGTGILVKAVLEAGYKDIILGLGGSATNDGCMGMAKALGYRFLNKQNQEIGEGGGSLSSLAFIDSSKVDPLLKTSVITVACDVTNPLFGPNGASAIYGPQKGARIEMVKVLDDNLIHFSKIIKEQLGKDIADIPGSGAAGGLGAGLLAFTNASLSPGFEIVKTITNLEKHIQQSNIIFTAEGKIDYQTQYGKTPFGVAQLALKYQKPVIALCGIIGEGADIMYEKGITGIFTIADKPMSVEESVKNASFLIQKTAERIMRIIRLEIGN